MEILKKLLYVYVYMYMIMCWAYMSKHTICRSENKVVVSVFSYLSWVPGVNSGCQAWAVSVLTSWVMSLAPKWKL